MAAMTIIVMVGWFSLVNDKKLSSIIYPWNCTLGVLQLHNDFQLQMKYKIINYSIHHLYASIVYA